LENQKPRKWRWGVNRWYVLAFIILSVIGVNLVAPVQPHIQVAAESLIKEPLFTLPVIGSFYLTNTLIATLLGDLIIIGIALAVRSATRSGELVPKGISGVMEMLLEGGYNLTESTAGKWAKKIFPWFATVFLLVLVANLLKLVPGVETLGIIEHTEKDGHAIAAVGAGWFNILPEKVEEGGYMLAPFVRGASTDLNFTLALALIAVVMTQVVGTQTQGVRYFSKFFNVGNIFKVPLLGFMDFLVGLLEIISEFSKILSFTFRLFGNMFSGMVLMALVGVMVPVFVPSMLLVFELFIGVIQAFVFGMLTMVFMAQATIGHGEHEEAHE